MCAVFGLVQTQKNGVVPSLAPGGGGRHKQFKGGFASNARFFHLPG
jgi:hypothetical protein